MQKVEFKNHLLNWYKEVGLPLDTGYVSHGGAMLMMGLRDETGDIDLNVLPETWDLLIKLGFKKRTLNSIGLLPTVVLTVTDKIDVHLVQKFPDLLVEDGIRYTTVERTLEDKRYLSRLKDSEDIKLLTETLRKSRQGVVDRIRLENIVFTLMDINSELFIGLQQTLNTLNQDLTPETLIFSDDEAITFSKMLLKLAAGSTVTLFDSIVVSFDTTTKTLNHELLTNIHPTHKDTYFELKTKYILPVLNRAMDIEAALNKPFAEWSK